MTTHVHNADQEAAGTGDQTVDLRDPTRSSLTSGASRPASSSAPSWTIPRPRSPWCPSASTPRCRSMRSTRCFATAGIQLHAVRQDHRSVHGPHHPGDGGQEASRASQPRVGGIQVQGVGPVGADHRPADLQRVDRRIHRTGRADLVRNFTFEFPTRVIARLLGLPDEDLPMFHKRAVELISYPSTTKAPSKRRRHSRTTSPSRSTSAEPNPPRTSSAIWSRPKSTAKSSVTRPSIPSCAYCCPPGWKPPTAPRETCFICCCPSRTIRRGASRRALLPQAIEEGLRFETPLTTVQRFTTEDIELEGVTIPARSVVGVCMGSANRDEQRWERSEEFDIFRKPTPHISFAAGEHTCLGLHLARLETRVAVGCLLNRLTNSPWSTDDDPHIHGQPFRSPTALPVTFDAK